ncbi:MAG: PKD repeat domain protein [Candidatus Alkanophagales archaeon MCA70_species_2]|nr:PKD repeat domain protein [Candidatus Alkanophaga liquidiphilum]
MGGNAKHLVFGVCVAFVLLCAFVGAGVASARTIYVPDDYAKIQWAVDAASAHDTIIVRPGTYIENVDVDKPVEIRSYSQNPSDTIVRASNSGDHVFDVTADNVYISGFTVTGATGSGEAGIHLYNSNYCRIENVDASNNKYGICLGYSSNNTITNNTVSNNDDGIYLKSSSKNFIYLNNFINNIDNVYSYYSTNIWNSTEKITYTYNGKQFTNYLGNYWSDYTGSDSDGDGIGDTPYSIDGDKDNYPLMERFENYIVTPVPNQPPIANFTYYPEKPVVDQSVTFDASSSYDPDGTIVSYEWDFGDGATASGVVVTHAYSAAGSYTVTLTVTDDDGAENSTSVLVTVLPPTPGVSVSTDRYEYTAGDIMLINLTLRNPTGEWRHVRFLWRFDVPDYGLRIPIINARLRLPPSYKKTFALRWRLPAWRLSFNASWHVALFDESGLISEDRADWRYITRAEEGLTPEEVMKEVKEFSVVAYRCLSNIHNQ